MTSSDSHSLGAEMNHMDVSSANGRLLNDICRALKHRRAKDGFSYSAHHAGRNDLNDPSTWNLPVYHGPGWLTKLSIARYLQAFPHYQDVLVEFGIDPSSIFVEENIIRAD